MFSQLGTHCFSSINYPLLLTPSNTTLQNSLPFYQTLTLPLRTYSAPSATYDILPSMVPVRCFYNCRDSIMYPVFLLFMRSLIKVFFIIFGKFLIQILFLYLEIQLTSGIIGLFLFYLI